MLPMLLMLLMLMLLLINVVCWVRWCGAAALCRFLNEEWVHHTAAIVKEGARTC
jgi:hypothetical protein